MRGLARQRQDQTQGQLRRQMPDVPGAAHLDAKLRRSRDIDRGVPHARGYQKTKLRQLLQDHARKWGALAHCQYCIERGELTYDVLRVHHRRRETDDVDPAGEPIPGCHAQRHAMVIVDERELHGMPPPFTACPPPAITLSPWRAPTERWDLHHANGRKPSVRALSPGAWATQFGSAHAYRDSACGN